MTLGHDDSTINIVMAIIIIPAKAFARDYVITGVRLSVRLSVCLFVTTIIEYTLSKNPEVGIRRIPAYTSNTPLLIIPAKARDYVFTGVGFSLCLFVTMITK